MPDLDLRTFLKLFPDADEIRAYEEKRKKSEPWIFR